MNICTYKNAVCQFNRVETIPQQCISITKAKNKYIVLVINIFLCENAF